MRPSLDSAMHFHLARSRRRRTAVVAPPDDGGLPDAAPLVPSRRGLTRTESFLFGDGSSSTSPQRSSRHLHLLSDLASVGTLSAALVTTAAFVTAWREQHNAESQLVTALFDSLIPSLAGMALLVAVLLAVRVSVRSVESRWRHPRFGRKGLILAGSSVMFVSSCLYRSLNVADEGAGMCRGPPTVFNAPVSGRTVATVGEIGLVVQCYFSLEASALRLGDPARSHRRTAMPLYAVVVAESMSWCGLLTGVSKFFCAEYVIWMLIACSWAWDSAELLHKSHTHSDAVFHSALLLGSLSLFAFNACHEIPHFFHYQVGGQTPEEHVPGVYNVLSCVQDAASPLWVKRLPFFYTYFVLAAWASVAGLYRYHSSRITSTGVEDHEVMKHGGEEEGVQDGVMNGGEEEGVQDGVMKQDASSDDGSVALGHVSSRSRQPPRHRGRKKGGGVEDGVMDPEWGLPPRNANRYVLAHSDSDNDTRT